MAESRCAFSFCGKRILRQPGRLECSLRCVEGIFLGIEENEGVKHTVLPLELGASVIFFGDGTFRAVLVQAKITV